MKHHIRLNGTALLLALLALVVLSASLAGCSPDIFGKYNNPRDPNNADTVANLQGLGVNQGFLSPPFSPSQTNYVVTVSEPTTEITFFTDADQTVAQVSINGNVGALVHGDNTIVITVSASFGNTKNYTIIVHRTYALRSTGPGGGLIFHVETNPAMEFMVNGVSCRYLEAGPEDAGTFATPTFPWGPLSTDVNAASRTAPGGGFGNTQDILVPRSPPAAFPAAEACAIYVNGGKDDWYLPNTTELNEMRTQLHAFSQGNFDGVEYWSSNQQNADYAWTLDFNSAAVAVVGVKNLGKKVRPIRAFR